MYGRRRGSLFDEIGDLAADYVRGAVIVFGTLLVIGVIVVAIVGITMPRRSLDDCFYQYDASDHMNYLICP